MTAALESNDPPVCPDDGTCHHRCDTPACFRVQYCGPLSGVYFDNRWPAAVLAQRGDP